MIVTPMNSNRDTCWGRTQNLSSEPEMEDGLQNTDVCQGFSPRRKACQKLEIDMLFYQKKERKKKEKHLNLAFSQNFFSEILGSIY